MTNEHHIELRAMAQRMREIAQQQTQGRRLALVTLATQLECGCGASPPPVRIDRAYPADGPLLPMPRAGE